MNATTCLQYCIKGMGKPLFNFAETDSCKNLITGFKKFIFNRENQIKELLIIYNTYFLVQAVFEAKGLPRTEESVIRFMSSNEFEKLRVEIINTVYDNYPTLMNCLSKTDKRKLHALVK